MLHCKSLSKTQFHASSRASPVFTVPTGRPHFYLPRVITNFSFTLRSQFARNGVTSVTDYRCAIYTHQKPKLWYPEALLRLLLHKLATIGSAQGSTTFKLSITPTEDMGAER